MAVAAHLGGLAPEHRPPRAVIDVACPIDGDTVALTNRTWAFSIAEMRIRLRLSVLEVVNDFLAIAGALPYLGTGDVVQIGARTAA